MTTSLRALASTGVPIENDSRASNDRLSNGEGTTTTVAASRASNRSDSDSRPANRMCGASGMGINFMPISTSEASPSDSAYVLK